ncbi:probable lysosomal cobalamin transporter [Schistocerca gregaria]|uniref:probable lysosomal cobalamin transporter n=1 Tax=Schistocerca gregaria TaxID=7010 RepID=UPI00211E1D13|nr:probable lysosomal cobalamin transporter [Schistocerca gregaria]
MNILTYDAILIWVIILTTFILNLFVISIVIWYYSHKKKAEWSTSAIAVLTTSLSIQALVVLGIDIFATNQVTSYDQVSAPIFSIIRILYYVFYGSSVTSCFLVLPFAYFWYEAYNPEESSFQRFMEAFKYTCLFIVCAVVILIFGLFIRVSYTGNSVPNSAKDWIREVLNSVSREQSAFIFLLGSMNLIGCLFWITFTAFGLSELPISLICDGLYSMRNKEDSESDILLAHQATEPIFVSGYSSRIDEGYYTWNRYMEKVEKKLTKFFYGMKYCYFSLVLITGILFTLVSATLVACILTSIVYQLIQNYCGPQCQIKLLANPNLRNLIDRILGLLQHIHPLDFILLSLILAYFYFATISGIRSIQIRCFFVKIFSFGRHRTSPQALIIASGILIFLAIYLPTELSLLAPQYTYWGHKHWLNETDSTHHPCDISHIFSEKLKTNGCKITEMGQLISKIMGGYTLFSVGIYIISWLFMLTFILGIVKSIYSNRRRNISYQLNVVT